MDGVWTATTIPSTTATIGGDSAGLQRLDA